MAEPPKVLATVLHQLPAPEPTPFVPMMVEERWSLGAAPGKWRYMTMDDLLAIASQLSSVDARRLRDACIDRLFAVKAESKPKKKP